MNRLLSSSVFQNAILSTLTLATTMSKSLIHLTFYPITKPIQVTTSMIQSTIYTTLFLTNKLLMNSNQFLLNKRNFLERNNDGNEENRDGERNAHDTSIIPLETNHNHSDHSSSDSSSGGVNNLLQDIAFRTVPAIYNTTQGIINSSISFLFSKESKTCGDDVDETNPHTDLRDEILGESEMDERASQQSYVNHQEDKIEHFRNANCQEQKQRVVIEEEEDDGEYIQLMYEEEEEQQEACEKYELQKQHSSIDTDSKTKALLDSTSTLLTETDTAMLQEGRKVEREEKSGHEEQKSETDNCSSSSPLFYLRVCDLNIEKEHCQKTANGYEKDIISLHNEEKKDENFPFSLTNDSPKSKLLFINLQLSSTVPHPSVLHIIQTTNKMIHNGLNLVMNNSMARKNISWKEEGSTAKNLKRMKTFMGDDEMWLDNLKVVKALEKEILLWSGSMDSKDKNNNPTNYAQKIPCFRAHGIIPSTGPRELAELLLDSSRVKLYNKFSNGRNDVLVFQNGLDIINGKYGNGSLKVVQSETSVPFSGNKIKMSTLLHARPIELQLGGMNAFKSENTNINDQGNLNANKNYDAYIIVSRSVCSHEEMTNTMKTSKNKNSAHATPGSRNEIMWGINILHEIPGYPNKTGLISFTQANSSAVPNFLAQKVSRHFFCIRKSLLALTVLMLTLYS